MKNTEFVVNGCLTRWKCAKNKENLLVYQICRVLSGFDLKCFRGRINFSALTGGNTFSTESKLTFLYKSKIMPSILNLYLSFEPNFEPCQFQLDNTFKTRDYLKMSVNNSYFHYYCIVLIGLISVDMYFLKSPLIHNHFRKNQEKNKIVSSLLGIVS